MADGLNSVLTDEYTERVRRVQHQGDSGEQAVDTQTFRGVMKGQTLVVLERAAPLADGTVVEVTAVRAEVGSPAALLAAMKAEPHVSLEDVAELDRAIAAGQRPIAKINPFGDEAACHQSGE
jgi:hypothetical protein